MDHSHTLPSSNQADRKLRFDALYKAHWKLIYQITLKKTGIEQDAYDIVQELFIEIWEHEGDLLDKCTDRAFLISILYNKIFLHFRKKGVQKRHHDDFQQFVFLLQDTVSLPDNELNDAEAAQSTIRQLIRDEIAGMPAKMKEVFMMSSFEGYSIEEIAVRLSLSQQTVKNQLTHARKRLRALFFFL